MNGRLKLGLIFTCLFLGILSPQIILPSVRNAHAANTQTVQTQFPQGAMLSGGLWAGLNHLANQTNVLNYTAASALLNSPGATSSNVQDPPANFTNSFRVTADYSRFPTEDEPSIAVTNQTGHVLMVVGANSLSRGLMPAYFSRDQGTTWTGPTFLPLSRSNDTFASDPGLAVNRTGTFYYSFLSISQSFLPPFGGIRDDLVVATSTDGGNWTNHVAVQRRSFASNSTISFELYDKEYIAVGPSRANPSVDTVYVTYTDFVDYRSVNSPIYGYSENATIMQVHSTDGGITWSKPVAISPTVTDSNYPNRLVQGSMPAVAPSGDVYVAYFDTGRSSFLNGNATIMISKSADGGNTFTRPTRAALIPQQLTYYSSSNGFLGGFRWWSSMFPSMDIAPDGTVYIAYGARQSTNSLDPADVFLVSSVDGGATWTQPVRVNDSTSQNGSFFPWLKVSSDGLVHIIWGDRRVDPAGIGYDIFYAQATNHGTSIGSNIRVTDVTTDPSLLYPFIGDYFNMAVSGNQVYPVWTDGRRGIRPSGAFFLQGETDIFTARLGSRDTANLAFGPGPAAGYLPTPVLVTGSGLPRDAFFSMKMIGGRVNSDTYGMDIFFSDKSGHLTDLVLPISDYFGAYPVELDEWISGTKLVGANLYVVDTRSLQVLITGPSIAHPGDSVTWNIVLVPPTGSTNPGGLSATLAVNQVLLTSPDGSLLNLTHNTKAVAPASYSVSTTLSANTLLGSYALFVNASQTGLIVQSVGIGSSNLGVSSRSESTVLDCGLGQVFLGQSTTCTVTIFDSTPGDANTPTGTVTWTTSTSGSFSPTSCSLSGTSASSSCSVRYTPGGSGSQLITAGYSGDLSHPGATQTISVVIANRATSLTVSCTPADLRTHDTTTCIATVTDMTPGGAIAPNGIITWTTTGTGSFSATSCALSGTGVSASCWVSFTPSSAGSQVLTGRYNGGSGQPGASQPTVLTVTNSATGLQLSSLTLGAITGGVGLAGVAAGVAGTLLARRRKQS